MCLYNIVAVAVAAHYYYSFDIVVAAAGVHECIAEIRKDIGIVAVDKTLVVAHTREHRWHHHCSLRRCPRRVIFICRILRLVVTGKLTTTITTITTT